MNGKQGAVLIVLIAAIAAAIIIPIRQQRAAEQRQQVAAYEAGYRLMQSQEHLCRASYDLAVAGGKLTSKLRSQIAGSCGAVQGWAESERINWKAFAGPPDERRECAKYRHADTNSIPSKCLTYVAGWAERETSR
jgi:hypothetical protein